MTRPDTTGTAAWLTLQAGNKPFFFYKVALNMNHSLSALQQKGRNHHPYFLTKAPLIFTSVASTLPAWDFRRPMTQPKFGAIPGKSCEGGKKLKSKDERDNGRGNTTCST